MVSWKIERPTRRRGHPSQARPSVYHAGAGCSPAGATNASAAPGARVNAGRCGCGSSLNGLSRRCHAAAGQRQHDRSDPASGSAQCGHVHPAISGRSMPCSCAFFISSFMRGRGAQLRHPIDHIDDQVEAGSGYVAGFAGHAHHFHRQRLVQDPGKLLRVCGQVDECARQLGDQAFEGEPVVQRGYSSDPLRLTAVTPSTTKAPLKAESRGAAAPALGVPVGRSRARGFHDGRTA